MAKRIDGAIRTFNKNGFAGIVQKINQKLMLAAEKRRYQRWVKLYGRLNDEERHNIREKIAGLDRKPLISVILPVFNIKEKWLRLCIDSVSRQLYSNWELCIADDNSIEPHIRLVLNEYERFDERIKIVYRPVNGHISAASNTALELAEGEFVVLLDHDDELTEDALFWVATEINAFPAAALFYSDEDKIDARGRLYAPAFKPDWSRDLFYSLNLFNHLSAYRTNIVKQIGGFRTGFEGSQDYDLALRFIEQIDDAQIKHIPRVLYHWRALPGSVALGGGEKPYAHERARMVLREHFERTGAAATIEATVHDLHRVRYALPTPSPSVSLIVSACVLGSNSTGRAIISATDYTDIHAITVFGEERKAERLNEAVNHSHGEVICFIDNRLSPLSSDWLSEMVSFAMQEKIGAVGAKLLNSDHTIASTGMIVGRNGTTKAAHHGLPADSSGYFFRAGVVNNYSAVSSSCMVIRRLVFDEIGGFDTDDSTLCFFAADLCLRLGRRGYRIVYTPYAELIFSETDGRFDRTIDTSVSAGFENDPFYNPNLAVNGPTFSIKL